jgi:probable addiction module antidote protein
MPPKPRRTLRQLIKPDEIAHEAYAVLMQGHRATRRISKDFLMGRLKDREVYAEFLKLCMEYDYKGNLALLREGLGIVVKAIGPSLVAKKTGINRVTLYRMLGKGGNPSLNNLTSLLRALSLNLWIVDKDFYSHREQVRRRSGRFS